VEISFGISDGTVLLYSVKSRIEEQKTESGLTDKRTVSETVADEEALSAVVYYTQRGTSKVAVMFQRLGYRLVSYLVSGKDLTEYMQDNREKRPLPGFFFLRRRADGICEADAKEISLNTLLMLPYCCGLLPQGKTRIGQKQNGSLNLSGLKADFQSSLDDFYLEKEKPVVLISNAVSVKGTDGREIGSFLIRQMVDPQTSVVLKEDGKIFIRLGGLIYKEHYERTLLQTEKQDSGKLSAQMDSLESAYAALDADLPVELLRHLDKAILDYEDGIFTPYIERLFVAALKKFEQLLKEKELEEMQKRIEAIMKKHGEHEHEHEKDDDEHEHNAKSLR
jgi:hypothetical protein